MVQEAVASAIFVDLEYRASPICAAIVGSAIEHAIAPFHYGGVGMLAINAVGSEAVQNGVTTAIRTEFEQRAGPICAAPISSAVECAVTSPVQLALRILAIVAAG